MHYADQESTSHSAVGRFRQSKLELQRKIAANTHQEIVLDFADDICYTEENSISMKCAVDDANPLRSKEPQNQVVISPTF